MPNKGSATALLCLSLVTTRGWDALWDGVSASQGDDSYTPPPLPPSQSGVSPAGNLCVFINYSTHIYHYGSELCRLSPASSWLPSCRVTERGKRSGFSPEHRREK